MKKILFVTPTLRSGGAEKSLVNLLNELPGNKYAIDLMLFKKEGIFLSQVPEWVNILDTPEAVKRLYFPIYKAGKYFGRKIIGTTVSYLSEKEQESRKAYRWKHFYSKKIDMISAKYDIAIAYLSCEVLYFVGDKVQAGKKFIWIHNDYVASKQPKKYDYPYLKAFDGIVTVSQKCAEILKEQFPDLQKKIYDIANITSSALVCKRADEFIPEEMNECQCNILSIGRLNIQKGFDMAITSASILKKNGLKFQWYVLGRGKLKRSLKRQIKREGVSDCFILLGIRENPYPYIKQCTLFAQTSRYEGKSVVLDEAKILAKPIVVTNYSTVRDQIVDKKEGIIVEINPEAIAEGIIKLIKDKEQQNVLECYLRKHEYGNQNEVNKYMDLMDGINWGEKNKYDSNITFRK